jgi:hypothetical protein
MFGINAGMDIERLIGGWCVLLVESSWNVMAHGDTRAGKWRGNWWMEWVASTLYTISEHGVSSITTADAHNSVASSRLNWRPRWFKWTRPFSQKRKSGFCACAISFHTHSTLVNGYISHILLHNVWHTCCTVQNISLICYNSVTTQNL